MSPGEKGTCTFLFLLPKKVILKSAKVLVLRNLDDTGVVQNFRLILLWDIVMRG